MKVQLTETVRPTNAYRAVVRAMREQRPLFVRYTRVNGSHTSRTVEPYAVTRNQAGDRYVRATDWKTGESRTLRLDRIDAYGLGPAFGFKMIEDTAVHMSPEDDAAYREWADEQQRAFIEHAVSHPELTGAK
jgi:predicted DNA-binding transcriptional regulator YafY